MINYIYLRDVGKETVAFPNNSVDIASGFFDPPEGCLFPDSRRKYSPETAFSTTALRESKTPSCAELCEVEDCKYRQELLDIKGR